MGTVGGIAAAGFLDSAGWDSKNEGVVPPEDYVTETPVAVGGFPA
jgi:hypothetical protein